MVRCTLYQPFIENVHEIHWNCIWWGFQVGIIVVILSKKLWHYLYTLKNHLPSTFAMLKNNWTIFRLHQIIFRYVGKVSDIIQLPQKWPKSIWMHSNPFHTCMNFVWSSRLWLKSRLKILGCFSIFELCIDFMNVHMIWKVSSLWFVVLISSRAHGAVSKARHILSELCDLFHSCQVNIPLVIRR